MERKTPWNNQPDAEYYGEFGQLIRYSEECNRMGWQPVRPAAFEELRRRRMLEVKAADYQRAVDPASITAPGMREHYDETYVSYERAVRVGCWAGEDGTQYTVDYQDAQLADPALDDTAALRALWPAWWEHVTASGLLVRQGDAWYVPRHLSEPAGRTRARACRRAVMEHMTAHPGEWMTSASMSHLAPGGRVLVNTEIDEHPFGYDSAAGTVYDAGPSGEPDMFALRDVLRALVADGSIEERRYPVEYRLAEWLSAAQAAERARVREKTWTSYVARGQAPAAGRRDPETGKAQWLAMVVDGWMAARPGSGARTDLAGRGASGTEER